MKEKKPLKVISIIKIEIQYVPQNEYLKKLGSHIFELTSKFQDFVSFNTLLV